MKNKFYKNENILFISPKFFNYENVIKEELLVLGARVDYYDEKPSNSVFSKLISRYDIKLNKFYVVPYYKKILRESIKNKYSYLFLIKGESIPEFFLIELKKRNPKIKFIYYSWDSIKNLPKSSLKIILKHFDKKYTFDLSDSIKHDLILRPLFFSNIFKNSKKNNSFENKIAFIGTAHSDRYDICEEFLKFCNFNKFKFYNYYYSPSRFVFWFFKIFDKNFKNFDVNKVSYKKLSLSQIVKIFDKSKSILDINHPNQTGLTMRVFEVLGYGRKLITTNSNIKKYVFYDKNNIMIVDRNNIKIDKDFFESEFNNIENKLLERMSVKGFLKEIFFSSENFKWINI